MGQSINHSAHRRVQAPERVAAIEAHQDEVTELHEAQEAAAAEAAAAAATAAHTAAMAAANLDGGWVGVLLRDARARICCPASVCLCRVELHPNGAACMHAFAG